MGDGPFAIALDKYNCRFQIAGPGAFSGIREIYVRDVYLRDGWLQIRPQDVVMDLGANMGNFSALALAVDPSVRVIAVEPSQTMNERFRTSIGLNEGFLRRTLLIRGFVGSPSEKVARVIRNDQNYADVSWITEDELIERAGVTRIDFLKCDIEGGEFGLLGSDSKLLAMTRALACEVHAFAGDVRQFMENIGACGFVLGPVQQDPDGTVTFLAKRVAETG